MIQYSPYMLTTLLSAVVILIIGICLLVVAVPRDAQLRNYRIARRFLAGAYIILSAVGLWEVLGGIESADRSPLMAFTLIAASFQSLLFTFSIITLINLRYMTARRVWSNVIPISAVSAILLAVLFAAPEYFYPVFYTALTLYCLQLIYYIALFAREYRGYRRRLDNFFSGNEYRRMIWVRNAFCMAACVGIMAIVSLFVNTQVYIAFTVAYTIFYVYFSVKYINYLTLFHRIAPVVVPAQNGPSNGNGISEEHIRQAVGGRIERKTLIHSDISLESLAKELNTNPTYLSRHINTVYGQNFRSWINSLRVAEAQRLITEESNLSVAEIGQRVGIPSTSTFYRQFASVTGMAPTEYRKNFGEGRKEN